MTEKSKKRSFAEWVPCLLLFAAANKGRSFGYELIHVIFSPSTSPEPKRFYLHADKLEETSEYFAGFIRFPGTEATEEIREVQLGEGWERLEGAWAAFIEFMYSGTYEKGDMVCEASMVVLAERLVAGELKKLATARLEKELVRDLDYEKHTMDAALLEVLDSEDERQRRAQQAFQVVRLIYGGTHRPYGPEPTPTALNSENDPSQLPSQSNDSPSFIFKCKHNKVGTAESLQCSATRCQSRWDNSLRQFEKQVERRIKEFELEEERRKFGYKNCRARKVVAEQIAKHVEYFRQWPEFRLVVEEVGEFASDLLMEQLDFTASELVHADE
ncbi:hypothetical protein BJ508DRAFT_312293 [Ascobolus immersus RN42]|uniref:BTB domain-containing protein n=1 Tax=Ascobolus immersus RN42 TaxID=1160509 RepID=A0A3N4HP69_ASCIM|nr:hypothetical protein BJ508DRAFT_312293 [Ascobolus immersus RN42]